MTGNNIPAAEDVSEDDFETVGDYHRIAAHHFDAKGKRCFKGACS